MTPELAAERSETENEFRIIFLIGNGSRLADILDQILDDPEIKVTLVVSHRKPPEDKIDVVGITTAKKRGIPTAYWNLIQMEASERKAQIAMPVEDKKKYRGAYMRMLADFLSQQYYKPNLVVLTGWDLILDDNIVNRIKTSGARIINVHPHPLPGTADDEMEAPDGSKIQVLRGEEVWKKAVADGMSWSGATVHEVVNSDFDVGPVLALEWVKIEPGETADSLRAKLNDVEDKIVPEAIKKIKEESLGK